MSDLFLFLLKFHHCTICRFWERANTLASPGSSCFDHFTDTFERFLFSVAQEVEDLADRRIRSVDDYLKLRRNTAAGWSTLALIEFGLDLPDEVLQHPTIVSLTHGAVEMIVIVNVIIKPTFFLKKNFDHHILEFHRTCIHTPVNYNVVLPITT